MIRLRSTRVLLMGCRVAEWVQAAALVVIAALYAVRSAATLQLLLRMTRGVDSLRSRFGLAKGDE